MTAPSSDTPHPYGDLIDRACDRFEALLRQGKHPRIEDFLAEVPDVARNALLRELVGLEIEILWKPGDSLPFAPYYLRFPDAAPILDELRAEWDQRREAASLDLPAGPNSLEKTVTFSGAVQRFRHFELQSVIGKGGFGVVWQAKDLRLQRDVALKFPRDEKLAEINKSLFLREARAAAKLKHPHIVAVYEVSDDEQYTYIVSELIDGESLKACLTLGPFSPREAALLVAKMAAAVHYAHTHGIVHRDLKPANVLVDQAREPHIADFGLAKREAGEESLSVSGHLLGTPTYMAPEQASGNHEAIDARTDIYALGVILYELLTGRTPFRGELRLLLQQIQDVSPPPPRSVKPDVPKDLEAICLKCLEKDRAKRYLTAQALADDLHLFLNDETLRGILAPIHNRDWKWLRKRRRQVAFTSAVFSIALLTAVFFAWYFTPPPPPTELRTVEFRTEPKGCEITVVKIDPETGEPDPTRIQHAAKGKLTPLTMELEPGDYLVVAVLASDEGWFHEVYRRVPKLREKAPMGGHLEWLLNSQGIVQVPQIAIPNPEMTRGMTLIDGIDILTEPASDERSLQMWHLPAFFVDHREVSHEDVKKWRTTEEMVVEIEEGLHPLFRQLNWLYQLEAQGKRLPSAAELYYLLTVICPDDRCGSSEKFPIEGLRVDPWEWTTTKPGGPFSGFSRSLSAYTENLTFSPRIIGCGDPNALIIESSTPRDSSTRNLFRVELEYKRGVAGARGVRSAKARRSPQDFIAPVSASQGRSTVEK